MKHSYPLVSVVVLSHDRSEYLAKALESIVGQSYPNLEIIVVDNKSRSSHEIARIVHQYSEVELLQNSENLGFTGGMNRGIEAASGEYIYCSVDDVVLDQHFIECLVEYMLLQPTAGLLSGIVYHEDGKTIACAGGEFSLEPVYRMKIFGEGEKDVGQFSTPREVKFVPGGVIFCKLDFLRQLNGFRKDFFMYSEDADLCARVAKIGASITVVPQAKARVFDAPHGFNAEGIAFHKVKNQLSLYLLHARLRVLPEFYLRYSVMNLLHAVRCDRKIAWPMIKAWGWFLLKSPALLGERLHSTRSDLDAMHTAANDETQLSVPTSIAS